MLIYMVHVNVRDGDIQAFIKATTENAKKSINEPGIIRFDICQQDEDPKRFLMIEVYKDKDAVDAHKATSHYLKWRDAVEPMMADKRLGVRYKEIFPDISSW